MEQEFERNIISITDEEGRDYELEVLSSITYQGAEYLALTPADASDDAEELEVSILKSVEEDGEPMLLTVEDEEELETVYEMLMDQLFEDEEEE